MSFLTTATLANCLLLTASVAHAADIDPTQQLGGNSPWFQGPNVNDIPYEVPDGCSVDMAAFVSRHGSRYPDQGAYNGWVALSAKVSISISPHYHNFADLNRSKLLSSLPQVTTALSHHGSLYFATQLLRLQISP